ncbi:MAG: chromosome segregation protein SMC [Gemmatimonadetes bacterium]|nr:MAG: chromosome segregation protein SMC [Gemmatimonadota bacterium]
MRLTRLELSGFKSFAGAVELPFDTGVTAIVGPNGCGKSNISDAVRWVLGEQSPRLLRGGKMEDVIFQGSTGRRPVNVAEVSLVFDNSDGTLPVAYQEVLVTRRLSRSGQSEYLLNRSAVRLRDIQDLLRGTGLGADAAVVMEAKMIEALLSERAEERRALFEEAAGIGLYRDRKTSTERRLEETAADLARLEDLVSEVQTQVRSLARQRGKAERYGKMIEERFGVALTLVRRELEDFDLALGGLGQRVQQLAAAIPEERARLGEAERQREAGVQARHTAEARRTEVERRLSDAKLDIGRLEGDLALAAERLRNAAQRRGAAGQRREQEEARGLQAERERVAAAQERTAAERDLTSVGQELAGRTAHEQEGRDRLLGQRAAVRALEEDLQKSAEGFRALEGERAALERERAELREHLAQASQERLTLDAAERGAAADVRALAQRASAQAQDAVHAVETLEAARRRVAELKERETRGRAARRQAEEALAQVVARRDALAELERERVGLAPAAQALLKARAQFGDAVIGPLSDFVRTSRRDAVLAEQLLGEWLHAVLVRDAAAVDAIRRWHEQAQPGPLVLLPSVPGPRLASDGHPLSDDLRVDGPAAAWVRALLAGHEVLDGGGEGRGRALRRANGAVFLAGSTPTAGGPLERRAELESLAQDVRDAEARRDTGAATLERTLADLTDAEAALAAAGEAAEQARQHELESSALKGDAERAAAHAQRQAADATAQVDRLSARLTEVEARLEAVHATSERHEVERVRLDERLGGERARLEDLDAQQEAAREQRVRWQVDAAQVDARLAAAREREARAAAQAEEARGQVATLAEEIGALEAEAATLTTQRAQWEDALKERRIALEALETAAGEAAGEVDRADARVVETEAALEAARRALDARGEEEHKLELERTEILGRRRGVVARVEAEWRKPLDQLLADAPEVSGDLDWLRQEDERLRAGIDAVGPVNALAVDEHGEEVKRLEFLMTQRDDLVTARHSLQQAAREIDQTAKTMFLESFGKVRENFRSVFQTLFGGGECDVRLANEDEPLESEIEIHAAPRGKRTQRIHLLSSGERTLVAVSLLFAIFLTKPSPFCLLDEVDAPLDDANVGRYVRLLAEFKDSTQFIVITHNPRTMQAADAVYGVTMQEPGVSTIVGVRLGQMEPA